MQEDAARAGRDSHRYVEHGEPFDVAYRGRPQGRVEPWAGAE